MTKSLNRRLLLSCLLLCLAVAVYGQKREIHILAVGDAHSAIEAMPHVVGIADSLRTLYPSLLVFSAGDNRTGDPINDKYTPSGYPMVALMNMAGFNGSALGNHEFDDFSLAPLCGLSTFRYICANMTADNSTGIRTVPYKLFDVEGIKVGVVGITQINPDKGTPDAHPDVLRGLHFTSPYETVKQYEWLRKECDATILLSHAGYQEDIQLAEENPWIDLIIGGHTHRQLSEQEPLHNGVLITQNRSLLSQVVHITLVVDNGKVVDKQAEYMLTRRFNKKNEAAQQLLEHFMANPYFKEVLTQATTPFANRNEIGTMVCDALRDETEADVAIMNYKGVRITKLDAGDITVHSAFEVDPYGSNVVTLNLRGDELEEFIIKYGQMNTYKFPHLSGLKADLTLDKPGSNDVVNVKLTTEDGKKINRKKTYRVATNSYVIQTNKTPLKDTPTVLNITTSDVIMRFLKKQSSVDYSNKQTVIYNTK
jgi:2',3'-cyclic-nucleotide 2'-phosphodiesterase (5'-nucleotidase family)